MPVEKLLRAEHLWCTKTFMPLERKQGELVQVKEGYMYGLLPHQHQHV